MQPELPQLLQRFFTQYLTEQRNLSANTCGGYRDTFRLLLPFLAHRQRCRIDQLTIVAMQPDAILAFLGHLESVRGNAVRTRNLRLAAIRTFVRFVLGEVVAVEFVGVGQRILSIPQKRSSQPILGFMTTEEIDSVLGAIDQSTSAGQRDHLLFTFLYNTGARLSEALQLRPIDLGECVVHLHGKGRKDRTVPLWKQTAIRLRRWCKTRQICDSQPIFTNRFGTSLSQDGAAYRLKLAVNKASERSPALRDRKISCHTFRHSCAMSLLQAGVALEVIALWLGHARPMTTHAYVEADLKMKQECLSRLGNIHPAKPPPHEEPSRLLAFLRAI